MTIFIYLHQIFQLELHLYLPQKAHRELCKKHNILITAYATLGSPGRMSVVGSNGRPLFESTQNSENEMNDKHVKALAQKYSKTPAQVNFQIICLQFCAGLFSDSSPGYS